MKVPRSRRITRRADFQRVRRSGESVRGRFLVLGYLEDDTLDEPFKLGLVTTRKLGNAVVRNRMKRRFRELLRAALPERGLADHDHVLIGRDGGIERDFARMAVELDEALARAAAGKGDRRRSPHRSRGRGKAGKAGAGG